MKQIETTKGHILAVKVPEGAYDFHIETHTYGLTITYCDKNNEYCEIDMPPGDWQIINTWSNLTEEQAAMMVDKVTFEKWKCYLIGSQYHEYLYNTALESFASLMHANGMYLVNPMGERPKHCFRMYPEWIEWQQYQEAVCDPLILFKPNK